MLRNVRRLMSQVNDLISRSETIPDLRDAFQRAQNLRARMQARLDGDRTAMGADQISSRLNLLQQQIDSFHSQNPRAMADAIRHMPRGSAAHVEREVLGNAANMALDFATFVNLRETLNEIEQVRVGQLITDLANNMRVRPEVIQAALDAHNDPQRLVDNLTALVRREPPILSVINPR